MPNALVSILIPFKNTEAFIEECIQSIVNQSYTNWEAIFVSDHSTDDSDKIVESYAIKDNRITCLKNEGSGIIDALKTAYNHSKGAYITRMDSDDIMVLNRLELMLNDLQQ